MVEIVLCGGCWSVEKGRRRRTSHLAAVSWDRLSSLVFAVSLSITATASCFSSPFGAGLSVPFRRPPLALSVPLLDSHFLYYPLSFSLSIYPACFRHSAFFPSRLFLFYTLLLYSCFLAHPSDLSDVQLILWPNSPDGADLAEVWDSAAPSPPLPSSSVPLSPIGCSGLAVPLS